MNQKLLLKKTIAAFVLLLLSAPVFAQFTYYSCNTREECSWDTIKEKFVDCVSKDDNSLFKLNKAQTQFEHTTSDIKSAYYVTKYEYDSKNLVDVYDVTSDVGNKYTFIVDTISSEIRIVGNSASSGIYMLRYHIKSTWSD